MEKGIKENPFTGTPHAGDGSTALRSRLGLTPGGWSRRSKQHHELFIKHGV